MALWLAKFIWNPHTQSCLLAIQSPCRFQMKLCWIYNVSLGAIPTTLSDIARP